MNRPQLIRSAMSVAALDALAQEARPRNDADYGSDRQTNAQNAFFDAFHAAVGDTPEFDDFCLDATTDERIDEALRIAKGQTPSASWRTVSRPLGFAGPGPTTEKIMAITRDDD